LAVALVGPVSDSFSKSGSGKNFVIFPDLADISRAAYMHGIDSS